MSNSGDANGVEFSMLYDVDEFHLDEGFDAFYASLPKNEMSPWRIANYRRSTLNVWRCPRCQRLFVFNARDDHKLSQLYYPQEVVLSVDRVPDFKTLIEKFSWEYAAEKGASYCLCSDIEAFDLVGNSLITRRFIFNDKPWEVWVTALPDGGIISYEPQRFQYEHYLYAQAGFSAALAQLPVPEHEIRQLRLMAWAKGKAQSAEEFQRFIDESL